jgi:hypothetical protein
MMRRIAFSLTMAVGLVLAGSAFASTADSGTTTASDTAAVKPVPAAQSATPATAAVADADQIICKTQPIVGSRLNSRLCMTKRRWDQMHKDGQEFIRNIDERSSTGQMGP